MSTKEVPGWTHTELKAAREELGLTLQEAAHLLDMSDLKAVQRMEADPSKKTARAPAVRVIRLYKAYLAGYRPDDWPERLVTWEARKQASAEALAGVRTDT